MIKNRKSKQPEFDEEADLPREDSATELIIHPEKDLPKDEGGEVNIPLREDENMKYRRR